MFDWDEHNEEHIWLRHRVSREEAEEVLLSPDRFLVLQRTEHGEKRHIAIGSTAAGRLLAVVYTHRSGAIRVVTARHPTRLEERAWRRARRRR